MGHIRITMNTGTRATAVESEWDEQYTFQSSQPINNEGIVAEIQHTFQRLLDGARMSGDKPLRVTITQENA